jgi:AcrR family transcriptional regulator
MSQGKDAMTEKRRGRPRNPEVRAKILEAARILLDEGGMAAVTMEELAARTGVGKPTIYRSWPNARAVAMAALIDAQSAAQPAKPGRSAILELKRSLRSLVIAFSSRAGRNAAALIAAADPETELAKAFRHHVIQRSREQIRGLVIRAMDEGVIRANVDIEVVLDLVVAPVFFRLLLGHGPLDEDFADAVVDHVLAGVRAK